jgi:hypothetical protein
MSRAPYNRDRFMAVKWAGDLSGLSSYNYRLSFTFTFLSATMDVERPRILLVDSYDSFTYK